MRPDHEILIIGAGFGGLGAGIKLQEAGFDDFAILEEGEEVGGTWQWNRYPGVAVDIPSFSYQFSFEQSSRWSRVYAPGDELLAYARHCTEKYGLRPKIRFGTRVTASEFDEAEGLWRLQTREGEELTSRFVIAATGPLNEVKKPEIDGVDDFAGLTMHTARWDHGQDLSGKRVAIIGTGASAVQVIPSIAPEVERLTVFQRTPIWCLPRIDTELPNWVHFTLDRIPFGKRALRLASQAYVEVTFPLAAHFHSRFPLTGATHRLALRFLRDQVRDPEIRKKLTPDYAIGCKRPSFSNEYLATFNRDNVLLETDPIERITASGIETAGGTAHEFDALILATGFKIFEPGSMPSVSVRGAGGVDLEQWWAENRFQAYEGVSVPGFPNMFMVLGPYGYNGSSYFNLIETQTRHIVRCLEHARKEGAEVVEVRREANDRYFEEMLSRRGSQVFWQESCSLANSYYFDPNGDVPLRPSTTVETMWRAARFDLGDYRFAASPDPARATAAA